MDASEHLANGVYRLPDGCLECGAEIPRPESKRGGRNKLYCSRACSRKAHGAWRPDRTCTVCGEQYFKVKGTDATTKYCSAECKKEGYKNVRRRHPYKCGGCGGLFQGKKQQQFCSTACKNKTIKPVQWHVKIATHCATCGEVVERTPYAYAKSDKHYCNNSCQAKDVLAEHRPSRKADPKNDKAHKRARKMLRRLRCCKYCKVRATLTTYCSDECSWRWHLERNQRAEHWQRLLRGDVWNGRDWLKECWCGIWYVANYSSQKCRRCQPSGEPLAREVIDRISERDGWRCQICGIEVLRLAGSRYADDKASADHIIAVANGGTDDDDNLQCACQLCNSLKADRVVSNATVAAERAAKIAERGYIRRH